MDGRQNFWTNGVCHLPIIPTSKNGDYYVPIIPTFELRIWREKVVKIKQVTFFGGNFVAFETFKEVNQNYIKNHLLFFSNILEHSDVFSSKIPLEQLILFPIFLFLKIKTPD